MKYKIGDKLYFNERSFRELFGKKYIKFSNPRYNFTIVGFRSLSSGDILISFRSNFEGRISDFTEVKEGYIFKDFDTMLGKYYCLIPDQLELDFGEKK
jgi:hypothetical protein